MDKLIITKGKSGNC